VIRAPALVLAAWRYACSHPWQTWLSFLGIALGVMMVVAVDLASSSARRAFALSLEAVNGSISHQIVGGSAGVPDAVFTGLRNELGLRRSAPTLSASVRVAGQELTLLGLDLVSEATLQRRRPGFSAEPRELMGLAYAALGAGTAVLMSEDTAAALGLAAGQRFSVRSSQGETSVELAATFASSEPVATEGLLFADIATAQALLGRSGRLDSIDLVLDEFEAAVLRAWLPPDLTLVESGSRSAALTQMTEAFHVNLLAMSLLALLVAALLIYNTVTLSVLQRQQTLGVLRSLGVTRGELVKLVLGEAALLGLLASLAGVLAGLLLGQGLVQLVTRTIDDLYFDLSVTRFLLEPLVLLKGLVLGSGLTLLAAAAPAWQAGRSQPVTLQQRAVRDEHWQRRMPLLALVGLLLLAAGRLLLLPERGSLGTGFVALNLLIFGFCLLIPLLMQWVLQALLWCFHSRLPHTLRLALRNTLNGISRTGLAVAALTVAVSVTVGVGVMVGSFRQTVILWLDQTLAGDVQVSLFDETALPPGLADALLQLPQVSAVAPGYLARTESSVGEVRVGARAGSVVASQFIKTLPAQNRDQLEAGEGVLLSEPLAWLQQIEPGDLLTLATPQGPQQLPVLGIFYDYSTGPGLVVIAEQRFVQWWPAQGATRLTLSLQDPSASAAATTALRQQLADWPGSYGVAANAEIRRLTLAIFDRTFAITHVLRLLALVVAFVGVLSALIALQLERMREYALLRATGMTVREVAAMIGVQTLVMGLLAGLLALPLGLLMSEVLIDVINRRSFGWSMLHTVPAGVLVEALLLALVAALLAGLQPVRRVAAVRPAQALREE